MSIKTDFVASWKMTLRLKLVSSNFLESSFTLTPSESDVPDPSIPSLGRSAAVEDVETSSDQVSSASAQQVLMLISMILQESSRLYFPYGNKKHQETR
jgi:hypothetical protein